MAGGKEEEHESAAAAESRQQQPFFSLEPAGAASSKGEAPACAVAPRLLLLGRLGRGLLLQKLLVRVHKHGGALDPHVLRRLEGAERGRNKRAQLQVRL